MATRYGGGITLLHVIEKLPDSASNRLAGFLGQERWEQIRKEHAQDARQILIGKRTDHDVIRKALAEFCASTNIDNAQCSFETHDIIIKEGRVVEEILKVAAEKECDLIVMGAHRGLSGATAVGSIAKGVLHQSRVPVLVVPPPEAA